MFVQVAEQTLKMDELHLIDGPSIEELLRAGAEKLKTDPLPVGPIIKYSAVIDGEKIDIDVEMISNWAPLDSEEVYECLVRLSSNSIAVLQDWAKVCEDGNRAVIFSP